MTKEEYEAKFHANTKITGFGIDVTITMPCPFCAAPDWLCYRIIDTKQAMSQGAVCRECGRGARAEIQRDYGGLKFEMVQTAGEPAPDYLPPMRRVPA